jgi:hypothetical protein
VRRRHLDDLVTAHRQGRDPFLEPVPAGLEAIDRDRVAAARAKRDARGSQGGDARRDRARLAQ